MTLILSSRRAGRRGVYYGPGVLVYAYGAARTLLVPKIPVPAD